MDILSSHRARALGIVVLFCLVAFGGLSTLAGPSGLHAAPIAPATSGALRPAAAPVLHGDLIVSAANSPYVISPATTGSSVYYQAGNISVQAGGTLLVESTTVEFVQFIATSGNAEQRLGHIYWVSVQGHATFVGSTLTTDANALNAYVKLSVNVSGGSLSVLQSTFAFPGWVSAWGAGTQLNINQSSFTPNLAVHALVESSTIYHDTLYGPNLEVGGGAHALVAQSSLLGAYRDNLTRFGTPGPSLSNGTSQTLTTSAGASWGSFSLPGTDPTSVAAASLYPTFAAGTLTLTYTASNAQRIASGNTLSYGGTYSLGAISYQLGSANTTIALSAAALHAINSGGLVAFLGASGAFSGGSLAIALGATSVGTVQVTSLTLNLLPSFPFNTTVTSGGILTAVDSTLDLNWNLTPGTPVPPGVASPTPWGSSKLVLTDGAQALLANVSLTAPYTSVFLNQSAVLPDATSNATFYRWATIKVTDGLGRPVQGAQIRAFYAYDSNQANNATVTRLNTLTSADTDLMNYVNAWDAAQGIAVYGQTPASGVGGVLLAATTLGQATLPDGQFVGGYHVAVNLPGTIPNGSSWSYVAVTPYPEGMFPSAPDTLQPANFPTYIPQLALSQVTVQADQVAVSPPTVAIGQTLTFQLALKSTGTQPVAAYNATLFYTVGTPFSLKPVGFASGPSALNPGHATTLNVSWLVTENQTGRRGTFNETFQVDIQYAAGTIVVSRAVTIVPAFITVVFTPPAGAITPGTEYASLLTVVFAGAGQAIVNITATGPGGTYLLAGSLPVASGTDQSTEIVPPATMAPGDYTLNISAEYNTRHAYQTIDRGLHIPGATTTTPFLNQKFFLFPLWEWIAIAGAAAAGLVAAFVALGYAARGKLVECGECGELIPETAPACPKCGAEFEADLVRCSRCGSTIPAQSKICPECAAQLLGRPEDETRDPERAGYADYVERYRAEAKKELGDNYSESAFWDWWKRQQTYVSFSQWRLQQSSGSRAGMTAPPAGAAQPEVGPSPPATPPRRGGGGGGTSAPPASRPVVVPRAPASASPPRAAAPPASSRPMSAAPAAQAAAMPPESDTEEPSSGPSSGMRACPNCSKEIPPDFLVCPFCGAVTR